MLQRVNPGSLFLLALSFFFSPLPAQATWRGFRCHGRAVAVEWAVPLAAEPSSEDAIRKVLADQVSAWNRGDLETFMDGYWRSPELTFFSGGTVTKGWQGTLERYRKRYQSEGQEMGKLSFRDLDVQVPGPDAAVVRGRFELTRSKDKPTGLFTLVFRRLPEGWRIVHDHTSSN
jgi:beta-aspartyl-peptidase (threonine type)